MIDVTVLWWWITWLQAARLCIQVVGGMRAKDVKRRSLSLRRSRGVARDDKKADTGTDKPLHWVNMQILDHRSACLPPPLPPPPTCRQCPASSGA